MILISKSKKIIPVLLIAAFLLPSFMSAQEMPVEMPETIDEIKEMGERGAKKTMEELPSILDKIWNEDVLPTWKSMYGIFMGWWNSFLFSWFEGMFDKIIVFLGGEVDKRKPYIKEEFEKEKEEIKEEAPEIGRSLWEKFKEVIK